MWHPQGGGAELATYMYTRQMIKAGNKVTIATNQDASFDDVVSQNCTIAKLPFNEVHVSAAKARLLIKSRPIRKKVSELLQRNDVIYIPGRLIFLSPWLRKLNRSLRIIVHLHEYQLICPHASLINMLDHKTCDYIWSDLDCIRCTQKFMRADGKGLFDSILGAATTAYWKQIADTETILDSVDAFITVSNGQSTLIKENLEKCSSKFDSKHLTLYNPVDTQIAYVPPVFQEERPSLGFFGGDRFIKGFRELLDFVNHLSNPSFKLISSRNSSPTADDERFEFLGNLDNKAMIEVFKRVWIVLFTSIMEEPSPYVVVESQLRGRPIIATSFGGVRENIVKIDFTGSLLKPGEYAKFEQLVRHYSGMINENALKYTSEVSLISKDFFEKRTMASYDRLLKLISC